jgi:hypothetical protein
MKPEAARMERTEYRGWKNCWKLTDGNVDLLVTTDVGPRIIRFGFIGGENMLFESPVDVGTTGGDSWKSFGGHRLWHAPESVPRTYEPDNSAVSAEKRGDTLVISPPREKSTGIRKELHVRMLASASGEGRVEVRHFLFNENLWDVRLAPWAITVMTGGGTAILPLPPRGKHADNLLPTCPIVTWAYTDMTDSRWTWLEKHILLRQDPKAKGPQKAGIGSPAGWIGYTVHGNLFVKKAEYRKGEEYPDMGCNLEAFTNSDMLECETMGPMELVAAGSSVEHREEWALWKGVKPPATDVDIEKTVWPKL